MTVMPFLPQRPRSLARSRNIIAVASGKGGVGKTWFAVTLVHALARAGGNALLFDGDLGLANVDIQLGLMPKRDLGGVLAGRFSLDHAVLRFDEGGFDIIAGRSGSGQLASLAPSRLSMLFDGLAALAQSYDWVVIDLGAGVDRTVREIIRQAGSCIVVTTDEPTSLTDAYAFVKVTHGEVAPPDLGIVVNMAASRREGDRTHATLNRACEGFLRISLPLLGVVRRDPRVRDAIRSQAPILSRFPTSDAAADVEAIARTLSDAGAEPTRAEDVG